MGVKAKKHLGQHFLADESIAKDIADAIPVDLVKNILEVGPGTGALTKHLFPREEKLYLSEIDRDSVAYLDENYVDQQFEIVQKSFLDADWQGWIGAHFVVCGNFPYNISSQIVFKILEMKASVPCAVGMFQKEVAERICAGPGSKIYGVISVLTQAYYDCEYLFTVPEHVFIPPPKVKSGVLRMTIKENPIGCDHQKFRQVVKATFNQRRKTIRNGLKSLGVEVPDNEYLQKRPEQLSVEDFENLTKIIFPG